MAKAYCHDFNKASTKEEYFVYYLNDNLLFVYGVYRFIPERCLSSITVAMSDTKELTHPSSDGYALRQFI